MVASNVLSWFTGKSTFARGVHPPHRKAGSAEKSIEVLPAPAMVVVPLHQHAGAPATPAVKSRTELAVGDPIGRAAESTISANVHASIAGTSQATTAVTLPNGRRSLAIPIKATDNGANGHSLWDKLFGGGWPVEQLPAYKPEEITAAVRDAGIVGLGGAAFPTHIKLAPPAGKPIDTILVNGCECEPYLTSDDRLMIEAPRPILAGLQLAVQAVGARHAVIAVEDNKPQAIASLREIVDGLDNVDLAVCHTKYPMGGERQLIPAVLGRTVPTGGFPLDIGIVVMNVATAAAVAGAVVRNNKLTHRVVSVSGTGIGEPKNVLVPIGTSFSAVLDYCGDLTADAQRVIAGGPMMGFSVTDLSVPVTKATGGITVLSAADVETSAPITCIRCGKCADVCPLRLTPTKIAHAAKFQNLPLAQKCDIRVCCECGCCVYVCPSRIPLVQHIRAGKAALMRT